MGEGGGGEEKGFSPSPLSLFRFHLSPFPQKRLILRSFSFSPETPDTQAIISRTKSTGALKNHSSIYIKTVLCIHYLMAA